MPLRRASASSPFVPQVSSRAHKTYESASVNHNTPPASLHSSFASTPQQRIVQTLVKRIHDQLPYYSGMPLDRLENNGAMQQIIDALINLVQESPDIVAWGLAGLADNLAKLEPQRSVQVLQSQLFVLKVLYLAMASRQGEVTRAPSRASSRPSRADSPNPQRGRQASSEYSTSPTFIPESPVMDENCAKYILSVMVAFLRLAAPEEPPRLSTIRAEQNDFLDYENFDVAEQAVRLDLWRTAQSMNQKAPETGADSALRTKTSAHSMRSIQFSIHSSSPTSHNGLKYEKSSTAILEDITSLKANILRFTGLVIYHLSSSNWKVVFARLGGKIGALAQGNDTGDTTDIALLTYCSLDRSRMAQVLSALSSLTVNMRLDALMSLLQPLRFAVWNWIERFPEEFNDIMRTKGRMDGSAERVFDQLYTLCKPGLEPQFWPTILAVNCIAPERVTSEYVLDHGRHLHSNSTHKHLRFGEDLLRHCNGATKLTEYSMICALDLCRAASFLPPQDDIALLDLAGDIAHEVKVGLWKNANRKAFWESEDPIAIPLYSEALVATYRLLPDDEAFSLFRVCLEPERSHAVKTCALRAILTISTEASRMPWQKPLGPLMQIVCPRLRPILFCLLLQRHELDQYGNAKRTAPRPKSRGSGTHLTDKEILIHHILAIWRFNPAYYFLDLDEPIIIMQTPLVKLWSSRLDRSMKFAAASTLRVFAELTFSLTRDDKFFGLCTAWIRRVLAGSLISIAHCLISERNEAENQRMYLTISLQLLDIYNRKSLSDHVRAIQVGEERLPAFALIEMAFLTSLTLADTEVSHLAAKGLRLLVHVERQEDAPIHPNMLEEDRSKRRPVYEQLGDPSVVVVGRVGHQKRMRRLTKIISYPSCTNVAIWKECYWRWRALSEKILNLKIEYVEDLNMPQSTISTMIQEQYHQWQNLTLFLASFGGVCLVDEGIGPTLQDIIPVEHLPDGMRVMQDPLALVNTFVTDLTNFLVAEDVGIRDVARDALGMELNSRLYPHLLRLLNEIIRPIYENSESELTPSYALFLDQIIAVLRLLMENVQVTVEDMVVVDLSSTLHILASFIRRFTLPNALTIKRQFCQLCEKMYSRTASLSFRKDEDVRHHILDIIMEWMQEPANLQDTASEYLVTQNELNVACLRSAVKLLDRLKLRPLDGPAGDESVHVVARLFIRYYTTLLRGLDIIPADINPTDASTDTLPLQKKLKDMPRESELRDLVITGVAHLVGANTEIGFKHCLSLAYDTNPQRRIIFARVFARVLGQGTKFDTPEPQVSQAPQARLRELVRGPDLTLAVALCQACPASDVEPMISVLLNVFDTRSSLMALFKALIEREVSVTENEAALFRSNSTLTRMMSAFARIHGYTYLRSLIQPLVHNMADLPPGQGYELDPSKVGHQAVKQNQRNVEFITTSFLEILYASISTLPSMFREICAYMSKSVSQYFPDAKFAALGAFIFLRFISPAVVSPESVDVRVPTEHEHIIRRGLMIITKIIQNLANNIFFGKEQYMMCLNDFLKANIVNVTRYLSELNKFAVSSEGEEGQDVEDEWVGATSDNTDIIVLHRYFEKNADKIGKELLSHSDTNREAELSAAAGKRAWDTLCALLVDLGQSIEAPRLSHIEASGHTEYKNLMDKYAHRNVDPVRHLFVEGAVSSDDAAYFVLHLSKIDVEALEIELLMYHIFRTVNLPTYAGRDLVVVLDCLAFSQASEVPIQWLKYCAELIPYDLRNRFYMAYILNPNIQAQQYMRRLYNIAAGAQLFQHVKACCSVTELLSYVPTPALKPLYSSLKLEEEAGEEFTDVTTRHGHQMHMPVTLHIRETHLRITSKKAHSITASLSCSSVEVVPLTDITDVYNVALGQEHEFIIRRARQGITLYFSSPSRDAITKSIRSAKAQLRGTQFPLAERFSRFSNGPATLLHVGMLSMDVADDELRSAAYDLLGSVCSYLQFDKSPVIAAKAGFVLGDPGAFVIQLSERLANFAPQLTLDFISEVSTGLTTMPLTGAERLTCLRYLSPWMKNIAHYCNPASPLYERSGARLRDCIRGLADLSVGSQDVSSNERIYLWSEIGKLDHTTVNIALDELIRMAIDGTVGSLRCENIAKIIGSLSSINVKGKLISRLRKSLAKPSPRSRALSEALHWNEIATLIRLLFAIGTTPQHSQLFVPEVFHIITLVSGLGSTVTRKSVYGIVINMLQALHLQRLDHPSGSDLLASIEESTQTTILRHFGLQRDTLTSEYREWNPENDEAMIENAEGLTNYLMRTLQRASGSKGLHNTWRARWMSLVSSTAFQISPAIQIRAFVVLGALAPSDVDDDFLYQILVALKGALSQSNETDTISVVTMLRTLSKIVPSLAATSRFIYSLFWLAVALLQSSHIDFFVEACSLLRVTLSTLEAHGAFRNADVEDVLLNGRSPLEDIACQLDQLLGLSFSADFSFSMASILFKGIRHDKLRKAAERSLRCLLRTAIRAYQPNGTRSVITRHALGYFIALISTTATTEAYHELVVDCDCDIAAAIPFESDGYLTDNTVPRISLEFIGAHDINTALLVVTFLQSILSSAQGDDIETQIFTTLLADIAALHPDIVCMAYDTLQEKIRESFAKSSNPAIIKAASSVFHAGLLDSSRPSSLRSTSTLSPVDEIPSKNYQLLLEQMDMQGLANSFQFLPPNRGHATRMINWIPELVNRIIE